MLQSDVRLLLSSNPKRNSPAGRFDAAGAAEVEYLFWPTGASLPVGVPPAQVPSVQFFVASSSSQVRRRKSFRCKFFDASSPGACPRALRNCKNCCPSRSTAREIVARHDQVLTSSHVDIPQGCGGLQHPRQADGLIALSWYSRSNVCTDVAAWGVRSTRLIADTLL
jgi:hypothetical protein